MRIRKLYNLPNGKHIIPRYLYHITDMEGFKGIQNRQKILRTPDYWSRSICGVFMIDLRNYTKRWATDCSLTGESFARDMLKQCAHGDRDLVIFRIPTEKLNKDDLIIRSQNRYFNDKNMKKHSYHTEYGANVREQSLFARRKEAVEYVYNGAIEMCDVEVLGVAKNYLRLLRQGGLKAVLSEFFKGQPEMQCVNLLSCKK